MAVPVLFSDGTTKDYPSANRAWLQGSVFVVSQWSLIGRELEEVETFQASTVALAEVYHGGVTTQLISGEGTRPRLRS